MSSSHINYAWLKKIKKIFLNPTSRCKWITYRSTHLQIWEDYSCFRMKTNQSVSIVCYIKQGSCVTSCAFYRYTDIISIGDEINILCKLTKQWASSSVSRDVLPLIVCVHFNFVWDIDPSMCAWLSVKERRDKIRITINPGAIPILIFTIDKWYLRNIRNNFKYVISMLIFGMARPGIELPTFHTLDGPSITEPLPIDALPRSHLRQTLHHGTTSFWHSTTKPLRTDALP